MVSKREPFLYSLGKAESQPGENKEISYVILRTYFPDHCYHCRLLRLCWYRWNRRLDSAGAFRHLFGPFCAILLLPKNASTRVTF
jgi:hypothetical protein